MSLVYLLGLWQIQKLNSKHLHTKVHRLHGRIEPPNCRRSGKHLSTRNNQGLKLSQHPSFPWCLLHTAYWLWSPLLQTGFLYSLENMAFRSYKCYNNLLTRSTVAFEPDYTIASILNTRNMVVTRKMSALGELIFSWSGESHTINKSTNSTPGSGKCYGEKEPA